MRGKDLNDFKREINLTMIDALKSYRPEIEIALGPVKVAFKQNQVEQNKDLQEDFEPEL